MLPPEAEPEPESQENSSVGLSRLASHTVAPSGHEAAMVGPLLPVGFYIGGDSTNEDYLQSMQEKPVDHQPSSDTVLASL